MAITQLQNPCHKLQGEILITVKDKAVMIIVITQLQDKMVMTWDLPKEAWFF